MSGFFFLVFFGGFFSCCLFALPLHRLKKKQNMFFWGEFLSFSLAFLASSVASVFPSRPVPRAPRARPMKSSGPSIASVAGVLEVF